jgi:isopentenyl phosphate kinase
LNQIIVHYMVKLGMNPYAVMPSIFTLGHKPITKKIKELQTIAESGLIPTTFGDVVHVENRKYSILSGDAIMSILAKVLRPSKVVFTFNVDGIYKDMKAREIVKEVNNNNKKSLDFPKKVVADVTGSMQRKVTEALKISGNGIDVLMVNGLKPERIISAITGSSFEGTIVKGRRNRT